MNKERRASHPWWWLRRFQHDIGANPQKLIHDIQHLAVFFFSVFLKLSLYLRFTSVIWVD